MTRFPPLETKQHDDEMQERFEKLIENTDTITAECNRLEEENRELTAIANRQAKRIEELEGQLERMTAMHNRMVDEVKRVKKGRR